MSTATQPTPAFPQPRRHDNAAARGAHAPAQHPPVPSERALPPTGSARISERSSAAFATRVAELVVEVLNGRRHPATLGELLTSKGLAWVAARRPARREPSRYRLRSVHTSLITARRVEMCWILDTTERTLALLSTAERRSEQWRCGRFAFV
ncbi:Rv3235 family protein [Bounagaea algeriensis]